MEKALPVKSENYYKKPRSLSKLAKMTTTRPSHLSERRSKGSTIINSSRSWQLNNNVLSLRNSEPLRWSNFAKRFTRREQSRLQALTMKYLLNVKILQTTNENCFHWSRT